LVVVGSGCVVLHRLLRGAGNEERQARKKVVVLGRAALRWFAWNNPPGANRAHIDLHTSTTAQHTDCSNAQ
jgi:hypothetical protein